LKANKKRAKLARQIAFFSGIAFEMAAIIGLGVWIGRYVDKKIGLKIPWFTILLSLLGVFLALYYTFSSISGWQKSKE